MMNKVYEFNGKKRILILDIVRGTLIILMCLQHLLWFIYRYSYCGILNISYDGLLYKIGVLSNKLLYKIPINLIGMEIVWCIFFMMSGMSMSLSRNNFKKGIKSLILFFIYYFLAVIFQNFFSYPVILNFGMFLGYGVYSIFFQLLEKITLKKKIIFTVVLFVIMIVLYILDIEIELSPLRWFYVSQSFNLQYLDEWSLFPSLFFFSFGSILGIIFYKNNEERKNKENIKAIKPLLWIGRNSFYIYICHIIIYPLLFILLTLVINGGL